MPFLVLLPPSKTMNAGGDGPPWRPAGPLADQRREVADAYVRTASSNRKRFAQAVEASGDILEEVRALASELETMPTLPAGLRYTGQLHVHAGYAELSQPERGGYDRHVRVVSGLLGLAAPDELIPIYRLPMGRPLPRLGILYTYWRSALTDEVLRQADGAPIWDLLSIEFQRALDLPEDQRLVVRFERPDGRAAPSVIGKQLKGAFARYLSTTDGSIDAAEGFSTQGYAFHHLRGDTVTSVVFRSG